MWTNDDAPHHHGMPHHGGYKPPLSLMWPTTLMGNEACNLHEVAHVMMWHIIISSPNDKSQMMWHKVKSNLTLPLPLKSSQT